MNGLWYTENTRKIAVVFVHGVLSDGHTCWTNENGAYWPEILKKDTGLSNVGIYIFTYYSGIFSSSYSISDAADSLQSYMKADNIMDNDVIIFCCHSMGGIVVRKWMVRQQSNLGSLSKEIGLFLVASPSAGSAWANRLSYCTRFIKHSQRQGLKRIDRNDWLSELHRDFLNLKESGQLNLYGQEILEDKSMFWRNFTSPIVREFSANTYFGNSVKIPESNHSSIAKPADSSAQQHNILVSFIKTVIARADSRKPKPRSIKFNDIDRLGPLKFDYKVQWTTFVGRSIELEKLVEFANSNSLFCWWIITGKGGSGKSRMALEFQNLLTKDGFFCEFAQYQDIVNPEIWNITQPTVYIIDYAARFSESILYLVKDLSTRSNIKHKVRILLIEREINGNWWERYFKVIEVKASVFDESPLNILGLNDTHLLSIIHEVLRKHEKIARYNDKELLGILKNVDLQMRPLFAIFLAVALLGDKSLQTWGQNDLLKYILEREKKLVQERFSSLEIELLHSHENLLLIATICNGLTKDQLVELLQENNGWIPTLDQFNSDLYSTLSGASHPDISIGIAPLLPDILGEFLVLEAFNHNNVNPLKVELWKDQIMKSTLRIDHSGTNFFVRRTLQDFPSHRNIINILEDSFSAGYHGRIILDLMKNVYCEHWDILEGLWQCTNHLNKLHLADPQKKIGIDSPPRVFQEATLLMVQKSSDIEVKLKYFHIMEGNTDLFLTNPFETGTIQADEKSLSEMSREEAKELLQRIETDAKFREDYVRDQVVIWADIPYSECLGIKNLLPECIDGNRVEEMQYLKLRLDLINDNFTDPRIRKESLESYINFYGTDEKCIDKMIEDLFFKILRTPRQVPPIDVTEQKRLFVHKICLYYTNVRNQVETAQNYYDQMLNHIFELGNHNMHVNGAVGMTHTAAKMVELALSRNDRLTSQWYYIRIVLVASRFNPIPEIITAMMQELGRKV